MDFEKKITQLLKQKNINDIVNLLDAYLIRAYNRGWNDSLWGDEAPEIDAQTNKEILTRIKTEPAKKTRNNIWERADIILPEIETPLNLQKKYQNAIRFAGEKHAGQKVPGTQANYIVHISNVAMEILMAFQAEPNFDVEFAIQVAILHDVIEDTGTTYKEIERYFGTRIAKAVLALTKNANIDNKQKRMRDSLDRIILYEDEVGIVKLADRITNLQPPPKHWSREKVMKYKVESDEILKRLRHCNSYLSIRLQKMIEEYDIH